MVSPRILNRASMPRRESPVNHHLSGEEAMYIKFEDGEHVLVRTVRGPDGLPQEVVLAKLGEDPELNLFCSAEEGRHRHPQLWEGVHDFHVLQALENYKRKIGNYRPALVAVGGKLARQVPEEDENQSPQ